MLNAVLKLPSTVLVSDIMVQLLWKLRVHPELSIAIQIMDIKVAPLPQPASKDVLTSG